LEGVRVVQEDVEESSGAPGDLEASAGLKQGDVLAGKYRVDALLGTGGMGVVVAARHLLLGETVAIKFLRPDLLENREAVTRFANEARAAVKIKSEHAARIYDVGSLDNGRPYIVMEFLEGVDLGDWLVQRGPLSAEQAVDFVLQACVALADAHALGIVHRDLKPANLFCARRSDGQLSVKVLDFGISKAGDVEALEPGSSVTHPNAVMGSPYHMSPEQMKASKDVDAQSDIWAIGITLYELLTGSLPFTGESFAEIAIKAATNPPPPLNTFRSDIPDRLEAVVFRCLEKEKERRYRNVADLASALLEFGSLRAKGWVEQAAGILVATGSQVEASPASEHARPLESFAPLGRTSPVPRGSDHRWGLTLATAAALLLAVVFTLLGPKARPRAALDAGLPSARPAAEPQQPAVTLMAIPVPVESLPPAAPTAGDAGSDKRRIFGTAIAKTAMPSPSSLSPRPIPGCSPPYTIDSAGHRQYKPECP
jgi:serine/threonine protein kinase